MKHCTGCGRINEGPIDVFALRLAKVLRELELMTERRADALAIVEEQRIRIRKLEKQAVPGIRAQHAIINDNCFAGRDAEATIDAAVFQIRAEALAVMDSWDRGQGVQFHLVFTVEPPPREKP